MKTPTLHGPCLAAFWLFCSACASTPRAALAPSEHRVASASKAGIELTAELRAGTDAASALLPIAISIRNSAASKIYVTLDDIQLIQPGRAPEAPLAPALIENRRSTPFGVEPAPPAGAPRARRDRVEQDNAESAFAGGIIAAGGEQRGVVYFPKPSDAITGATLRVRVRTGDERAPVEVLEIPYTAAARG